MKLLALDMDGTCLNSYSKISKKTMDADNGCVIPCPDIGD